jgi:hypothetical protein
MKIEFKSYTGGYPALCCGELTLVIDGEEVTFGSGDSMYDSFWVSGGKCWFSGDWENEHIEQGPWICLDHRLPKKYRDHGEELIEVFNKNVPAGCCGGCL